MYAFADKAVHTRRKPSAPSRSPQPCKIYEAFADMAELADALDSGSSEDSLMQVRFLLSAPNRQAEMQVGFSFAKMRYHDIIVII